MARLLKGRYEILDQLGSGPRGTVYHARDTQTGHPVAVKVLKPQTPHAARGWQAMQSPITTSHPMLLPVIAQGQAGQHRYRITPYIDGPDLGAWLQQREMPLTPKQGFYLVKQINIALAGGQVHGNLKPTNIHVQPGGQFRLSDAGLPALAGPYTAPEAGAGGTPTTRADVYSLGKILAECWQLQQNPRLAALVSDVLAQATHPDPRKRQLSVDALAADLRAALTTRRGAARPAPANRRWPLLAALIAVPLLLLLAAAGVAVLANLQNTRVAAVPTMASIAGGNAPQPTSEHDAPTLPPTWTPTDTPTPTPTPTITLTPTATHTHTPTNTRVPFSPTPTERAIGTLTSAQLINTYWEGNGDGSMYDVVQPGGRYWRFTRFPVTVWIDAYGEMILVEPHRDAVRAALGQISRVLPIEETAERTQADITLFLMTDNDYEANAPEQCQNNAFPVAGCTRNSQTASGEPAVTIWVRISGCYETTILHELTHGLGVFVHSPYPEDVMYAFQNCLAPRYSNRDLTTLNALYSAPAYVPR